jgi:branched-chain amino acid transport system substrate-binding protein/urea transport system substrate-binding protein
MQGIEMLVDEVNGAGGVLGRQIEIVRADNRTDPKTSVERTQQLIHRDEVDAVIGPITRYRRGEIPGESDRSSPFLFLNPQPLSSNHGL